MKKFVYESTGHDVRPDDFHRTDDGVGIRITSVNNGQIHGYMVGPNYSATPTAAIPMALIGAVMVDVPGPTMTELMARLDREHGAIAETMKLINEHLAGAS